MKKFLLSLVAFFVAISMFGQQRFSMYFADATGAQVREVKAALNEDFIQPRLVFSDDSAQYYVRIEYSSTNPDAAEIDMVTGVISLKGEGTTTITAVSGQTEQYYSARAQYNLIVEAPQDTTPAVEPECLDAYFYRNGEQLKVLTMNVGDIIDIPALMDGYGTTLYGRARIDDGANVVTLTEDNLLYATGQGNARLIVLTYQSGGADGTVGGDSSVLTCEYELPIIVDGSEQPEPECPDVYFVQNGRPIKELRLKVRESVSVPDLMDAAGAIYTGGRVTIDSTNIAMVSADNMIYGLAEGYATLHVLIYQVVEGGAGQLLTCEYELPIVVEPAAQEKRSPELSWGVTDVYAELGAPFEAPVLSNPHNVPLNKIESQNPDVAEISPDGKEVYINGIGDAEIFAESFETDSFYAQSVHYFIHVYTIGLRVKGINVTSANAEDVLGDSSRAVTFEVESRTLHLNGWNIDATGMELTAMIEDTNKEGAPLEIMLHGVNSITNANICIQTQSVPVVIMGQTQRDVLTLDATQVAVSAPILKIHQCGVNANAPVAAIALGNELAVSINSHLLATSTSLAIQTHDLILADGEEGVAILTPGVRFEKGKGFMTEEGKYAKEVEIGKVPVVVPEDEVTTIDFTQTDPEGNENVVFSTSAEDNYNQETGQLEISTSLTDEQVAEALEQLVPGSSEWVNLLPGSISFVVPAGKGTISVNCFVPVSGELKIKVDGQAVITLTPGVALGWVTAEYDVTVETRVVVYFHYVAPTSAPARLKGERAEETMGLVIKELKITPAKAPQGIENIQVDELENGSKMLIDGQLYIIREGRVFNASGTQVK